MLSAPVRTLDIRDTQKRIRNAVTLCAMFYMTNRLHEQFFLCNFYLSHIKANTPASQKISLSQKKLANFSRYHEHINILT